MTRENIFAKIDIERARQNRLHPTFSWAFRMSVLTEEVGEVARAINEHDAKNLREELIQVAAVAVRWIEHLEDIDE